MNFQRRSRSAVSLAEVLVALALTAGPLLLIVELVHGSTRATRASQERAAARLILLDLLTDLEAGGAADLDRVVAPDLLPAVAHTYLDALPAAVRASYGPHADRVVSTLRGRLEARGSAGLHVLTLTATLSNQVPVSVSCLLRPAARGLEMMAETSACQGVTHAR